MDLLFIISKETIIIQDTYFS